MITRQIALLCALAILGSLFLPWLVTPLGENLVPWQALSAFDRDSFTAFVQAAPPETLLFLGSFLLAGLFFLAALVGLERRWLAFLTGLAPIGLAVTLIWRARERLGLSAMDGTLEDLAALFAEASAVLGTGGWAWIGGAALLFLCSIFDPGRPKARPATGSRW